MNILLMCVANSARSQMAEGLARHIFPNDEIESAGSEPSRVNPYAVEVMQEIGIDISKHYSKNFDQLNPRFLVKLDYVITLCAEEVCPTMASRAQKLHWPMNDPAKDHQSREESLNRFRSTRDLIRTQLLNFKRQLDSQ